jgi:hypothetical protein
VPFDRKRPTTRLSLIFSLELILSNTPTLNVLKYLYSQESEVPVNVILDDVDAMTTIFTFEPLFLMTSAHVIVMLGEFENFVFTSSAYSIIFCFNCEILLMLIEGTILMYISFDLEVVTVPELLTTLTATSVNAVLLLAIFPVEPNSLFNTYTNSSVYAALLASSKTISFLQQQSLTVRSVPVGGDVFVIEPVGQVIGLVPEHVDLFRSQQFVSNATDEVWILSKLDFLT